MADVRKAVEVVGSSGLGANYFSDLTTTDTFLIRNTGRLLLHFKKTGAGNCIVTIQTPGNIDGLAIAERTITVLATTGDQHIAQLIPRVYNDVNGDVKFTLDDIVGLTLAVMEN